jgi:hypothetical protein
MVWSNAVSCGPAVPPFASNRHASLASEFVLSTVPLADGLGLALDVMVLLPETVVVAERLGIEEDDADTVDDVLALCPGVRLAVRVIVLLPVMLVLAIDVEIAMRTVIPSQPPKATSCLAMSCLSAACAP